VRVLIQFVLLHFAVGQRKTNLPVHNLLVHARPQPNIFDEIQLRRRVKHEWDILVVPIFGDAERNADIALDIGIYLHRKLKDIVEYSLNQIIKSIKQSFINNLPL